MGNPAHGKRRRLSYTFIFRGLLTSRSRQWSCGIDSRKNSAAITCCDVTIATLKIELSWISTVTSLIGVPRCTQSTEANTRKCYYLDHSWEGVSESTWLASSIARIITNAFITSKTISSSSLLIWANIT